MKMYESKICNPEYEPIFNDFVPSVEKKKKYQFNKKKKTRLSFLLFHTFLFWAQPLESNICIRKPLA